MPFGAAGSEFGVPAHLHLVQRHFHPQHTLLARNLLQHCDVSIHGILLIMTRLIQFAILIAVIVPFGWMVSSFQKGLGQSGNDIWLGIVIGFAICFALWRWDDRTKARQGDGKRRD